MTDPDAAMEKNLTAFSRKFEVQKRQIMYVPQGLSLSGTLNVA
jgi:hypothetical protein